MPEDTAKKTWFKMVALWMWKIGAGQGTCFSSKILTFKTVCISIWLKGFILERCLSQNAFYTEYIHFSDILNSLGFWKLSFGHVESAQCYLRRQWFLVVAVVDVILSYKYSFCYSANKWRF